MRQSSIAADPPRGGIFGQWAWWLLLLYVFMYFARPFDTYNVGVAGLLRLVAFPMIGCWALAWLLEGCRPRWDTRQLRWILLLLGLFVFSTLFAIVTFYAYSNTKYMVLYIFLPLVIAASLVHDAARLRTLVNTFGITVAWLTMEGVRFYVLPGGGRWRGAFAGNFLADPNDYALFMNCFWPVLGYLALTARRRVVRLFWWVVCAGAIAVVLFTYSRGGFITLAVMAVYLLFRARRARGRLLVIGVAAAGVVSTVMPASYWESLRALMPSRTRHSASVTFEDESVTGRRQAWEAGFHMARDRPLVGVGPGNFEAAMWARYLPPGVRAERSAHSLYVQLLGELGVPGVLWLLGLTVVNLRTSRRVRLAMVAPGEKDSYALAVALETGFIGFLTGSAFLSVLYYPQLYWLSWLMGTHAVVVGVQQAAAAPASATRLTYGMARP